jgi:hypothetical protein
MVAENLKTQRLPQNGGPRGHPGVHPNEHTIRNPDGCIGPLRARSWTIELQHAGFVAEQGSNKIGRDTPLLGYFDGRPMLLFCEAVRIRWADVLVSPWIFLSPRPEETGVDLNLLRDYLFCAHLTLALYAMQWWPRDPRAFQCPR